MKRCGNIGMMEARDKREVLANILEFFAILTYYRWHTLDGHFNPRDRILREIHAPEPASAKFLEKLVIKSHPKLSNKSGLGTARIFDIICGQ